MGRGIQQVDMGTLEIQKELNKHGYNLAEDGVYGPKTTQAIKNFQSKNGLAVDGIVGKQTGAALFGMGNSSSTGGSTTGGSSMGGSVGTGGSANTGKSGWSYDPFKYDAYKESDIVTEAKNALDAQLANKPGAYQSQWQNQLNDVINKILNREKFSYDLNGDALYQQYKDKYTQQAKMAMGDAIGQASAMTGGYGNSYAQSVGQQMYAKEMQNLNDIVPELYAMAYDKYNQEGQDLYNQYSMLGAQEEQEYGRHRDTVADWLSERDYLANRYDSERDFDYGKYDNERNFAYGQYSDDRNLAYTDYRNTIADSQWQAEFDEAKRQFDAQMALKTVSSSGSTGSTGGDSTTDDTNDKPGGGSYDNGSLTSAQVKALQKALGVTADGMYGDDSKKAAGGLSAEEAYKKYVHRTPLGNAEDTTKKVSDFNMEENNKIVTENGGSYYGSALTDLREMKKAGKSNGDASAYLQELVGNSIITPSEYSKLYGMYRDNRLG